MDYKFRFYSPLLNRFIQPDTITPGGPQGLNRYSYVNNNPVNFNDPTGHMVDDDDGGGCSPCTQLPPPIPDPDDDSSGDNDNSPLVCSSRACDPNVVTIVNAIRECAENGWTGEGCIPANQNKCSSQNGQYLTVEPRVYGNGCHVSHYETGHRWSDLNWGLVSVNMLSLVGNVVLVAGALSYIGAIPAGAFYGFTQVVSLTYDAYNLNGGSFTFGIVSSFLEGISKDVSAVSPGISALVALESLTEEYNRIEYRTPIVVPDVDTLIYPMMPLPPGLPPSLMGPPPF